jgi:hypothetical protein
MLKVLLFYLYIIYNQLTKYNTLPAILYAISPNSFQSLNLELDCEERTSQVYEFR